MSHPAHLETAFLALLAITNPVGCIPFFLALTQGQTPAEQRRTALTASAAVLVTLLVALFLGSAILGAFNIRLPAFSLAGSVVVASLAWSMLHMQPSGQKQTPEEHADAAARGSVAIVPLAIPLLSGPGAMSATITLAHTGSTGDRMGAVVVIAAVALVTALSLFFAPRIQSLLGVSGMNIMTRLFGLLLLAISIEGAARALENLFPALARP